MATQAFEIVRPQFPVPDKDPTIMSRVQGDKIMQEQDVHTKLLSEILVELRALVELTANEASLVADDFRKD